MKKYPWNEHMVKYRKWAYDDYTDQQKYYLKIIKKHMQRNNIKNYGCVEDLNPKYYSGQQIYVVFMSRIYNRFYKCVEDLNPKEYTWRQMLYISLGRGSCKGFNNIDYLDPTKLDDHQFLYKLRGYI